MKSWIKWGIGGAVICYSANVALAWASIYAPDIIALEVYFPTYWLKDFYSWLSVFFDSRGIVLHPILGVLLLAMPDVIVGFAVGALIAIILNARKKRAS